MAIQDDTRRRAKGSKKEVRPGVWRVRVSAGYRRDGTQKRKSATVYGTRLDADAKILELAGQLGSCIAAGDPMTLTHYFVAVFLPSREATTTKANVDTYRSIYRNHIEPALGGRDICSITNTDVQRWIYRLPPQSAPAYARALRAILNQAAFDHVIAASPMEHYRFKMPKGRDTSPGPVWGAAEVAACIELLRGHTLYPLWLVMAGAGLSRSEALALDWCDIAFTEETNLRGERCYSAVIDVRAAQTATDGYKETKNARRVRRVPLRPLFANPLHEAAGEGPICVSYHGTRLTPCYVPRKWKACFGPGGCLEGLPFVPLNRMRATYSTLMQAAGVDDTIINAMQGRSDSSQVLYANYLNPNLTTYSRSAGAMERYVADSATL